ncbi:c-type cytochrome biogenesis protein CcsB [Gryllotalpicola sp.]|uniref:c-type cytochrome biogenesis protein CcsB n=1 Tax=Gryllotalpicola sp. TaxID=1932787 RepID=UPI002617F8F4|nr:c-type cytochrome biogenesis protein CcsB [Gryllotalpicola sp.]
MTGTLSDISLLASYVAAGFYIAAFVAFVLDLARRGSFAATPAAVSSAAERRAARVGAADGASGSVAVITEVVAPDETAETKVPASLSLKVAMWLTTTGWFVHLASDVLRGIAADRVPWANMWEFSLTGTLVIVGIFLLVNLRWDLRWVGTFVVGLVFLLLMIAQLRYYVQVAPLPPALQSYWLVVHILVAILGTAFFAIGFALAAVQLLQTWREKRDAQSLPPVLGFLKTLPKSESLEALSYRINIIGFIFWTFTLIAGAIWAEKAWGRYWGWDTKEVWTFIIWVIYAGYIHARATRGWRGSRASWLSVVGFIAVMFNFGVVNVFFHGLHSYSGLS